MTPTPTEAQIAVLRALHEWQSSAPAAVHDLLGHPAVQALGLSAQDVEGVLASGQADGLFMTHQTRNLARRPFPAVAHRGRDYIRDQGWPYRDGYAAPQPPAPPAAAPAPEQPTEHNSPRTQTPLQYQEGDQKYLAVADRAPQPGHILNHPEGPQVVTALSKKTWRLSQRQIDDEDLFEFEGKAVLYVYHRPATPEQVVRDAERRRSEVEAAGRARQAHAATPEGRAQRVRTHVERHGRTSGGDGDLPAPRYTWPGTFPGASQVTLSTDGTRVRVVERYGAGGDFSTDRAARTLQIAALPAEVLEALDGLSTLSTGTERGAEEEDDLL